MTTATDKEKTASELVRDKAQEIAKDPATIQRYAAAQAMKNAKWGKDHSLQPDDLRAMEAVAQTLNLSIALGHLLMLGGNMFITYAGHLQHAHGTGQFDGFEEAMLPRDEFAAWGVPETALFAWKATAHRKGTKLGFTEVGWSGPSRDGNQPVAKNFPGEMARKRARARALSLAFPVGLTSVEEIQRGEEIPDEFLKRATEAAANGAGIGRALAESLARAAGYSVAHLRDEAQRAFKKDYGMLTRDEVEACIFKLQSDDAMEDADHADSDPELTA